MGLKGVLFDLPVCFPKLVQYSVVYFSYCCYNRVYLISISKKLQVIIMNKSKVDVTKQEDLKELTTFRALEVLTWKYILYRKYYWTWTLFEFILPICLVYLVLKVNELFIGKENDKNVTATNNVTIRMFAESAMVYDGVFYHSDYHGAVLMTEAFTNMAEITGSIIPFGWKRSVEEVSEEVHARPGRTMGIIFLECKPNLRYIVREKKLWYATSLLSEDETDYAVPNIESSPYINLGFAGLQYFINTAFMENVMKEKAYATRKFSFNPNIDDLITAPFPYTEYRAKWRYHYKFPIIIAVLVAVTSLMILGPLMYAIIDEKSRGMNEMMMLAGLPQKLIWMGWFIDTLVPAVLMYAIIVYLQLKFDYRGVEYIVIRFLQPSLLWALIALYFAAQLAFCFTFCTIFHSALFGILSCFVITMILGIGAVKAYDYRNLVLVHLSCLSPIGALVQAFKRINHFEILELKITWNLIFLSEFTAANASLGFALISLIVDIPIYLFLTYYINSINPGRYGSKKSPFFLFQKRSSIIANVMDEKEADKKSEEEKQNSFVEPTAPNADLVFKLSNVTNKIGNLKDISLSMNSNEIYVIVGPLLSGKTSLVSLITGLLELTEGEILFNGVDLDTSENELRKSLGYCPQENRLFQYFKVMDHLMLFGRLKGLEKNYTLAEANKHLNLMGIKTIADNAVPLLSVENKRKINLTVALMGDSQILILDEPTTGFSMVSQRKIWNILKKLKKTNHTIIMTTPFMKDAINIGDRIAILNYGVVQCEGSISFLQSKFGVGYDVTIKKEDAPVPTSEKKNGIRQSITQIINAVPGAAIIHIAPTTIFLKLPAETAQFPVVFKALEGKRKALNIQHISVSYITLETIYSRIGGESFYNTDRTPLKKRKLKSRQAAIQYPMEMKKLEGYALLLEQHKVLFIKKAVFSYRRWHVFLYRVVIPTILLTFMLRTPSKYVYTLESRLFLSLNTYSDSTVLTVNNSNTHGIFLGLLLDYLKKAGITSSVKTNRSTVDALLDYRQMHINNYRRKLLMAISFEKSIRQGETMMLRSYFNPFVTHSLPVLINTLHNVMISYIRPSFKEVTHIQTTSHPYPNFDAAKEKDLYNTNINETASIITVLYITMAFFTIDLLNFIASPTIAERIDGFKRVQLLSNVSPTTYWINTLIFDSVFFFLIMFFRVSLFRLNDEYGFFNFRYDLGTVITFTFYKSQTNLFKLGPINLPLEFGLSIIKLVLLLVPPLNLSLAFEKFLTTWRVNHILEAYTDYEGYPNSTESIDGPAQPSREKVYYPYLTFASDTNPNGILGEIIFFILDVILYGSLILGIETGFIKKHFDRIFQGSYSKKYFQTKGKGAIIDSSSVQTERNAVKIAVNARLRQLRRRTAAQKSATQSNIVLLVHEMTKIFNPVLMVFRKPKVAVSNITFMVHAGECLGILGPDEAGKSTLIKMLVGEMMATKGDAWIMTASLSKNKDEYLSQIGYCTQTNSFLEELTGQEILHIVTALRGYTGESRNELVTQWTNILGLDGVILDMCSTYDISHKRKLCGALALIGEPKVSFLDEPGSHIDPLTRKSLYSVLGQRKYTGQVTVISSSSMKECEILCERFIILVNGELRFVGTKDELKKKYASGFKVRILFGDVSLTEPDEIHRKDVQQLINIINSKFGADKTNLIEETVESLFFEVSHEKEWSEIFKILEDVMNQLKFVNEYQLDDKSLDDAYTFFLN